MQRPGHGSEALRRPQEAGHLIPPGSSLGLTRKQVCGMVAPLLAPTVSPEKGLLGGFQVWWPLDLRGEFFFLTVPHGMWDLSSLTRDQTHILCIQAWSLNHWTAGTPESCFLE